MTTLGNQAKKFVQRSPECECQPAYSQSRKIEKAASKLPRGGFVAKGHQRTAILGASSLTRGGSTDFINSCGVGGRCPWELLAALREKDVDGVSHIELGINGSDGGVQK